MPPPPPSPSTTLAFLGLAVLLWVFARVHILRRQLARGPADRPGVTRIRLLHRLAAWRGLYVMLAVFGAVFVALLWWSWR